MPSARAYLSRQLRALAPPRGEVIYDPITLLRQLSPREWGSFFLGFSAWTWDAFDFHSVTLSYNDLHEEFKGHSLESISLAVTLALMTRPIGGVIFGILADRFGRKWPFIANCSLLIVFVLLTGFCKSYEQFLAVRALFGVAMGGLYGNAAATALEDVPSDTRGLLSGLYQGGYPLGYALASGCYQGFHKTAPGWRGLFYFGSAMPVLLIIARLFMGETQAFDKRREFQNGPGLGLAGVRSEAGRAIKRYWPLLLYLIFLLMGTVNMSHGTQDTYPRLLRTQFGDNQDCSPDDMECKANQDATISKTTKIQIVANLAGVLGSALTGYVSQIFGRRLTIMVAATVGGALLYPYTFTTGPGIYAAAVFEQFCIQGVWGVIPIYLIELSPAAFRTFVVGTSYQAGVLLASGSNTIILKIASRYYRDPVTGIADLRVPMCLFAGVVSVYVILMAAVGPERRGWGMAEEEDGDEGGQVFVGIQGTNTEMGNVHHG